ncbi:HpsJ family protein [Pantanalinema rosaneae CENA516]|uniref:HpsJ-like protein, cyanoexosortase A-associated n=1 Tax=Pantanalinema rosaneae TaxID=1620701 RepID=UPI003D6F92D4
MTISPNYSPNSSSQNIGSIGNTPAAPTLQQQKTMLLSRRVGYALLMLCFIDLLYVLIPPEFMNPVWEYQTIGDLVKLVPVPLLALMLIFYGNAALRSKPERLALNLLSWLTLIAGIVFLLLVPLTVSDAMRIHRFNNNQISTQVSQQRLQLDTTRKQLEKASPQQLQNLVPVPDKDGNLPDIPNSPQQAKTQILNNLNRAKEQAEQQASQARTNLRQNLVKNTIKLVAQSLIAGCFFIYVWTMTAWTRRKESYQYEMPRKSSLTSLPKLFSGFGSRSRRRL